jgi:hypothetical protein
MQTWIVVPNSQQKEGWWELQMGLEQVHKNMHSKCNQLVQAKKEGN